MRMLLWISLGLFIGCGAEQNVEDTPDSDDENWIQLFNGSDLDDWRVKITGYPLGENWGNTFAVRDSNLVADYAAYDTFESRFGHIFYRSPFSYYRLRATYRFVGEQAPGGPGWAFRNSGLMLHAQAPETMLQDQDFPISIEVQLLGGSGEGERSTANLCTPGTHVMMGDSLITQHCVSSTSPTFHGDQWVTVEVTVLGDSLFVHDVNGQEVLRYTDPQIGGGSVNPYDPEVKRDGLHLTGGYIALQGESHPVQYRSVELLNLVGCMDPTSPSYRTYFMVANPDDCE